MRRSTTDGRNDQLRHWLADGNLDVAVADFTGMPTGVELVDFYQERMVWSSRTRCDWISPAAGRRRMRPPSAPVTCHPWSTAARSYWAIRKTSTDASATCCSAEPDSLPWLRAGNLIRDSFGISACDYRWSAVDDFIACAPPEHQQPLTGMIPAGTVGSRLIVVEHGLDVVAIGIMDERGIVARPVVRARTGLAVVGAAGRETRLMERLDGVGGLGAERDV